MLGKCQIWLILNVNHLIKIYRTFTGKTENQNNFEHMVWLVIDKIVKSPLESTVWLTSFSFFYDFPKLPEFSTLPCSPDPSLFLWFNTWFSALHHLTQCLPLLQGGCRGGELSIQLKGVCCRWAPSTRLKGIDISKDLPLTAISVTSKRELIKIRKIWIQIPTV